MNDSGDTYPGPDDSTEETVGEALADYLGLVEETIRTQVTDEDIRARIRHAMDLAKAAQVTEPAQVSNDDFGDRRLLLDTLVAMIQDPQKPVVLAGPGGTGKTTAAEALAGRAREMGHRVWWVSAADPVTMSRGLTEIAKQLGDVDDVNAIAWGEPDGADRLWRLLETARTKWLLVFDEADDPSVLTTANSPAGVQDLTGWVRSSVRGLALVTSRETDRRMWEAAQILRLGALQELDAAQMLLGLAPSAGDTDQALALAHRLGRHALSLQLAGSYLRSHVDQASTFAAYEQMLDEQVARSDLYGHHTPVPMTRALEVSLKGLERRGIPQTRPVLRLASCYAPAPIPPSMLNARALTETGLFSDPGSVAPATGNGAEKALRELMTAGILQSADNGIVLHTAIIEAERASLDQPTSASTGIWHAAIKLLYDCASRLPYDDPTSWPQYLLLGPHLLSLLDTSVDHVDREHFGLLMETTARTAGAFNLCGAGQAGIVLGERALRRSAERGDEQRAVLRVRHAMTWAVADRGDLRLAENMYRENLQIRMRVLGPEDPDVLLTRHELAWIAACQGELAEAETRYRETLRDSIRVLGPDEPRTMLTRHELAWAIANQGPGRLGEAREMLEAVLSDRRRVLGAEHHRTLTTLHELAWITAQEGRWEEAETAYLDLLGLCLRKLGEDHQVTMVLRHELAWITAHRGRTGEAESRYRDVLAQRRRTLGAKHPETRATETALEELRGGRIIDARHLT